MHILVPMPIIYYTGTIRSPPDARRVISRGQNGQATRFETILPSFSLPKTLAAHGLCEQLHNPPPPARIDCAMSEYLTLVVNTAI